MSREIFEEDAFCAALSAKHVLSYCHGCFKSDSSLRKCSGCRMFVYCSTDCQKKDWRLHKHECASCKAFDGVANEEIRLVMRLAVKWASGDMGDTVVDGGVRSLATLQHHEKALEAKSNQFLNDFKKVFQKQIVSDNVIKRGNHAVMVPTSLLHAPSSLKEARHSYINELMPRTVRREILKRDYNFDCECDGCLDEERNNRMEGWYCEQCKDGWLPPQENSKCTVCGWRITQDHYEVCRLAEETARSGNKVLLSDEYKREAKLKMANTMMPIFEGALYMFNVLRIPCLRTLFENAVIEKSAEEIIKYAGSLLRLQQQYQESDDLALCHLKFGLAQAYKSLGMDKECRELLAGVREVFRQAYGTESKIYTFASMIS
ncbi:MYND finger [Oesophagostomum dentatum]|uniref:MYND finger n=1 Tax=Oesophagostomum dentatum TaxID=61180 RepID=A0A0B1TJM5_OESDE|nr:MYND finger [Oesophagostomum dentatum]